jgi:ribosomal protein S6--L-glutamate ligase
MVRFTVRPNPSREDLEVEACAEVIDRRAVTSSNGERELRYVIATRLRMGDRSWPIEVTLANRQKLTYRMLLGRQAIRSNMLIDPEASFRQPKLSYTLYSRS